MRDENGSGDEPVLESMVEFASTVPGAFSAEIWLGYFPGVSTDKQWVCRIEADLPHGEFGVWARSAREATALAIQEAWRRVPNGADAEVDVEPEWYWRDAWVLASVFLAGNGSDADLAAVLGATRRTSTPSVFMDRSEFGWAVSRLLDADLLAESDRAFTPSRRAVELWSAATDTRPTLAGNGFTRSLVREMQSSGPASGADVKSWSLSDGEYLRAIQAHIERVLPTEVDGR
jgi:hypothetical protein